MDKNEHILSLIGLCLRGRNLEVGEEPVEAVARARDARVILLASDAADNTLRRVKRFAETGQCVWLRVPFTKRELGQATGRTAAAVAAITDIGLAVAVVRRLAELDPERYDEDLAKLELKAKRAAERKSEAAQHEKNLRRGIKRPKKAEGSATVEEKRGEARGDTSGGDHSHRSGNTVNRKGTGKDGDVRPHSGRTENRNTSFRKEGNRPSRNSRSRSKAKANPYAHSRPVKKGKGSFRKKES